MADLKRVMAYLPDEEYQRLRRLSFERHESMSELIRRALGQTFGWDVEPAEGKAKAA